MPNLALPSDTLTGHSGGLGTSIGVVIQVDSTNWRCTLRDITHSEVQPIGALVVGSVLPPVHDPSNGIHSYVHYGYFGGRRMDSWCVPAVFSDMTDDERKDNQFFLRLLSVTIRIGKLDDDVVYEVAGGNAIVQVNVTKGNILIQGADGTAKAEIEQGGRIHFKAKAGMTVDADDGTGPVSLAKLSELQALISTTNTNVTAYATHTHPDPVSGSTGSPSNPMSTAAAATGTEVLRGK